jgi:hypothetical protein
VRSKTASRATRQTATNMRALTREDAQVAGEQERDQEVVADARFIEMLRYKAELVGIRVVVSEASYTSKCSFLDLEPVGKRDVYAGKRVKRVKRGLFQAANGRRLNADVNGAYNILRKGVPDAFGNGIGGCRSSPGQDDPGEWAAWQQCPCCLGLWSDGGIAAPRWRA